MVGEFGMNMYTLLYLKWITNKNLLHSTRNSAQCYVAAWMGGEFGICMVESLCCSPETITTFLIGYTPIQKKTFLKNKAGIIDSNKPRFASEIWCLLSVRY